MSRTGSTSMSLLIGASTTSVGQGILFALESQTRAGSENVQRSGPAFLAPDSFAYLANAETFADVMQVPWNRWLYIAILHAGDRLGDPGLNVVVLQLVLASLGAASLHRIGRSIGGDLSGLIAAMAFAANPLTAQWFRFVLTETLFYVLVIFALHSSWRIAQSGPRRGPVMVGLAVAMLASIARPNGILLAAGVLTVIVVSFSDGTRRIFTAAALMAVWAAAAVGLLLGLDATGGPAERSFIDQLYGGVVIEGDERVIVSIPMPATEAASDQSASAAIRYVSEHPIHVLGLFGARLVAESLQIRPHYPARLNIAVGAFMLAYFAAGAAGWVHSRRTALPTTVVALGLPTLLLVGATFAVPEGRYGWSYLVLLAPMVGLGASRALRRSSTSPQSDQSRPGPGTAR